MPISPEPPNGQNNNSFFIYFINFEILIKPFRVISSLCITLVFNEPLNNLEYPPVITSLKVFLDSGERKIDKWYNQEKLEIIDFSNNPQFFMNINTPEDLEKYKLEKIKNDN